MSITNYRKTPLTRWSHGERSEAHGILKRREAPTKIGFPRSVDGLRVGISWHGSSTRVTRSFKEDIFLASVWIYKDGTSTQGPLRTKGPLRHRLRTTCFMGDSGATFSIWSTIHIFRNIHGDYEPIQVWIVKLEMYNFFTTVCLQRFSNTNTETRRAPKDRESNPLLSTVQQTLTGPVTEWEGTSGGEAPERLPFLHVASNYLFLINICLRIDKVINVLFDIDVNYHQSTSLSVYRTIFTSTGGQRNLSAEGRRCHLKISLFLY